MTLRITLDLILIRSEVVVWSDPVDIGVFPSGLQQQQMRCPSAGIGPILVRDLVM